MKLFKKESKIEKEEYFSFCVEGIYEHKNDLMNAGEKCIK